MSTSIDTALRLLREADPLTRELEQPLLAGRKSLSVPGDLITDGPVAGVLSRGPSSRRRRWLLPIAAASAVVVVGSAAVVIHDRNDGRPTADGTSQHQVVSHRDQATRAVADLLALLPVLPGADPVDHSPLPALDQPFDSPVSDNLLVRTRWWTAPGTADQAVAYVSAHAGPRLVRSGSMTGSGGSGPSTQGLDLSLADGQPSDAYSELDLIVTFVAYGGGVAERADAQAIWLPERTAAEEIPAGVTAVDIVVARGTQAATVRRTLTGDTARSLAQLINRLPTLSPGTRYCPNDPGGTDVLTFRGASPPIVVTAEVSGCASVQVGGAGNPTLQAGGLDAAVMRALGLPANYGS